MASATRPCSPDSQPGAAAVPFCEINRQLFPPEGAEETIEQRIQRILASAEPGNGLPRNLPPIRGPVSGPPLRQTETGGPGPRPLPGRPVPLDPNKKV